MENNGKSLVVLFDVNETLLDMSKLKKKINSLLNSKRGFRIWFGLLLHYSLVDNDTDRYHDFSVIADATLDMAAKALEKKDINESEKKEALALMIELSAYADVKKGLKLLKEAGFRLATLTNSSLHTLTAQLKYAGLTDYFEAALSIETVRKYKPHADTYYFAAKTLNVDLNDIILVAAHGWDITGAVQAGMKSAFIERKGQSLYSLAPKPDYKGKDLVEVAKAIIEQSKTI